MNKEIAKREITLNKVIIMLCFLLLMCNGLNAQEYNVSGNKWLPVYDFNATQFQNPAQEFGPFARWWWPGNDVNQEELRREVNLFVENAFGGVEIQPFSINVPMSSDEVKERVLSWDSPEYYENLRSVLDEARKRGLIVDMTNGSGWPAGGPFLDTEDGFLNLVFEDVDIVGGTTSSLKVPTVSNETDVPSELITVLASKTLSDGNNTTLLNSASTIVLTDKIRNDSIRWDVPEGNWKVIAFWSRPNSLTGTMVASPEQGPVLNHLDSDKVIKNLEYLFRAETGLEEYLGNPLRAVFDDSYEFAVDRHFSNDFIAYFKEKRGYDITPWLPANMQEKYNYVAYKNPNADPDFSFGSEDWRLRYDYDLTISELFGENLIGASRNWLEEKGMLHRTQAYGMYMDMIGNAGKAAIPETESMLQQEANLKIMSSGAHLYNRPVVSAESVVIKSRAYMTTPQKIRLAVDKLFAAGVTQIIYHGVPYRYINESTTELGWYPFYMGFIGFSSHLGEGTQFWKYQKEVNEYIARTQYALRSGKPHADVLIYFPFLDVDGMPDNPEEIFTNGVLPDVEPPMKAVSETSAEKEEWAREIYPIINQLEASGITWDWVNDESIQAAKLDADRQIDIRGNKYQSLILAGVDVIQLSSAKHINSLTKDGMKFLVVGDLPTKQPSFLNWEENDKKTVQLIKEACSQANSRQFENDSNLNSWIEELNQDVKFTENYTFTRQVKREMKDGSRLQFIWNKSDKWQPISLQLDTKFKVAYWFDAETGSITSVKNVKNVSRVLAPYSTIILYASTNEHVDHDLLSNSESSVYQAQKILEINNWNIQVDDISIENTVLFDWRNNDQLKFTSEEGSYKASFNLNKIEKNSSYLIDLGKVRYTANVTINGQSAGHRINAPYTLDITKYLKKGENTIEVWVTPGQLNGLIGEGEKENPKYSKFKGRGTDLMSAGLIGPVILYKK